MKFSIFLSNENIEMKQKKINRTDFSSLACSFIHSDVYKSVTNEKQQKQNRR